MPLLKRATPFDDPDWIYELKMDGFRALAIIEHGRAQLISRNGHPFAERSLTAKFAHSIDVADRSSKICYSAVETRRAFSHSIC